MAGQLEVVADTADLLVINKPATVPMHPCGAYKYNSLFHIVDSERAAHASADSSARAGEGQHEVLHIVHRLDRLTSGLSIFAKHPLAAKAFGDDLTQGRTAKTYLARVVGDFGANLPTAWARPGSSEGSTEGFSIERLEDGSGLGWALKRNSRYSSEAPGAGAMASTIGALAGGASVVVSQPIGVVSNKDGVYDCAYGASGDSETPVHPPAAGSPGHRADAKEAVSVVRKVSYNGRTSLVEVKPLHGRTHQIRLHLLFLGHPIANDPCYGGELHYGDKDRGIPEVVPLPQSSLPPRDPACDALEVASALTTSDSYTAPRGAGEALEAFVVRTCRFCHVGRATGRARPAQPPAQPPAQRLAADDAAADDAAAVGAKGASSDGAPATRSEGERHCGGIWLHALKYERRGNRAEAQAEGGDWSFQTLPPSWAQEGYREPECDVEGAAVASGN
jgi:23S rRNA-/tRNA-specific pseudouridylate synthase